MAITVEQIREAQKCLDNCKVQLQWMKTAQLNERKYQSIQVVIDGREVELRMPTQYAQYALNRLKLEKIDSYNEQVRRLNQLDVKHDFKILPRDAQNFDT